jgi:hypothetical protein
MITFVFHKDWQHHHKGDLPQERKRSAGKLLSTYAGNKLEFDNKRLPRKENISELIPCPNFLMVYIDCERSLRVGFNARVLQTPDYVKETYLKIFFQLLDLACVNSKLLWRRIRKSCFCA